MQCSIPLCDRTAKYLATGWCHTHYMRWYTTGDVQADKPLRRYVQGGPEVRFRAYVDYNGPVPDERPDLGPCWVWTGTRSTLGYGITSIVGKPALAHRWAFEYFMYPIPQGLEPDHLCRNPPCVNYERHLELVTHRENSLRSRSFAAEYAKRTACGAGHEYTDETMVIRRDGSRGCRVCERRRCHDRYMRRKAAQKEAQAK